MFLKTFCCGPVGTNAYLFSCPVTKRAAVVDCPQGSALEILPLVQELGFSVEMLLLTHSHWDHIADLSILQKKLGAKIYVHADDAKNVEKPGSDGLRLLFPIEGSKPDVLLKEGQILHLGNLEIQVLHTPGHSLGGVCFYLAEEKVLFSGDTLFHGTIGRLDLPTSSTERMWPSLEKLAHLPPDTKVFPGHGDPTSIGRETWLKNAKNLFTN